jgi:hypothetical protein
MQGVKTNRQAIGARIRAKVQTAAGPREIFREVTSGGSFGDSPFRVHIGLEQATAIQELEIRWPTSHAVQTLRNLSLDRSYLILEGATQAVSETRKTFPLSKVQHSMHEHK